MLPNAHVASNDAPDAAPNDAPDVAPNDQPDDGEDGPDARRRGATTEAYAVVRRREERRANEADGPSSSSSSYPFDDALTEHSVRPNHQRQNHQHVRREVFGSAAHERIDVPGGDVLDDTDDEPADHRAGNRVEPAENHHGKDFEANQRQIHVDAEHVAPEHAAER